MAISFYVDAYIYIHISAQFMNQDMTLLLLLWPSFFSQRQCKKTNQLGRAFPKNFYVVLHKNLFIIHTQHTRKQTYEIHDKTKVDIVTLEKKRRSHKVVWECRHI